MKISALERSNKNALICYGIMNFLLVLAYLIEVFKGSRTITYYVVFCILALIPFFFNLFMYKRNHETPVIKYAIPGGFCIFYLFIIFTTSSPVAYVYAFLVAIMLVAMDNAKITKVYVIAVAIGNVVSSVILLMNGTYTADDMPNIEIRVLSSIVFALFLIFTEKVVALNARDRLDEINEEKKNTADLMEQVIESAKGLTNSIETVSGKMDSLSSATDKTMNAMEEVNQETADTADSIQIQLNKTEEISDIINQVDEVSEIIVQDITDTKNEINISTENIEKLISQVDASNKANENVSRELVELKNYTDQMQSIIDVIDNVTDQTSLLSLNASIEAARAGEAGKGFAVVAGEISALATQTQQATESITKLINNISNELSDVVGVIEEMIENAKLQNEATEKTAQSFAIIHEKNDTVYDRVMQMNSLLNGLTSSNRSIAEGIETISASTQQVTAHSNETYNISMENSKITNEISDIIDNLNSMAKKLSAMTDKQF